MQIFHTCLLSKRAVFGQAVKKHKIAAGSAGKSYFKDKSSDVRADSWSNQLQQTDSRHLAANLICLKVRCSSNSEQPISSLGQQAALFLLLSTSRLYYSTAQMGPSGWVSQRARHQRGLWTGQMMDPSPKYSSKKREEENKQLQQSEIQGKKKKFRRSCFLGLHIDYFLCWDAPKQDVSLAIYKHQAKQEGHSPKPCSCCCFFFSLLQKAVRNMDADVKIETVWSFITWLSNWCKKYLLAAPVAIAPHVVMLAHLAGFGPQHFCKWKVLCVVH